MSESKPHSELARRVLENEKKHRMVSITLAREILNLERQYEVLEETTKAYEFDMARMREQLEAAQDRIQRALAVLDEVDGDGGYYFGRLRVILASNPASVSEGELSPVGAEGSHPRRLAGSGSSSETDESSPAKRRT